mmetsp:Transcript_13332/g.18375  ORF Transcript_13332/g.18375 Transcript_13332/m.18375 type:complete len:352 (-) Transcript_13332:624-1679(-)
MQMGFSGLVHTPKIVHTFLWFLRTLTVFASFKNAVMASLLTAFIWSCFTTQYEFLHSPLKTDPKAPLPISSPISSSVKSISQNWWNMLLASSEAGFEFVSIQGIPTATRDLRASSWDTKANVGPVGEIVEALKWPGIGSIGTSSSDTDACFLFFLCLRTSKPATIAHTKNAPATPTPAPMATEELLFAFSSGLLCCGSGSPFKEGVVVGVLCGALEGEEPIEGDTEFDGLLEGVTEEVAEGVLEGVTEGVSEGVMEGVTEGDVEGVDEGEGVVEGVTEGESEGVGLFEGEIEGVRVGLGVEVTEGVAEAEGVTEGVTEGVSEGVILGVGVGVALGRGVGARTMSDGASHPL